MFFRINTTSKLITVNSILAFLFYSISASSQNLLPNPSFETAAWPNANNGSVDWVTGPTNVFGAENARTGTRFMGESMGRSPAGGATDFREYIKNSLTTPLIPGNTYECSIYVSLSENYGSYACNNIGFVTTATSPLYGFNNAPIPLTPVYATPTTMTSKTGWTQVFGTFVATAADSWVTIGNFNTQNGTTWSYVGPATGFYYGYYFMDDVCLGPPGACGIILPVELLSFTGKTANKKVDLAWKTATELNCLFFKIERSHDGKIFEEIGRVNGNGTTNSIQNYKFTDEDPENGKINYYRLREYDVNGKSNFSNMIAIEASGDMNTFINAFPIPAQDKVTLEFNGNDQSSTIYVYNAKGSLILKKEATGYEKTEISDLQSGYYMAVLVSSEGKTITKKFVVSGE